MHSILVNVDIDTEYLREFLTEKYPDIDISEMSSDLLVKEYIDGIVSSNLDYDYVGQFVSSEIKYD